MVKYHRETKVLSAGDVEWFQLDYTDLLDSGESITGTPVVAEQTSSDLTISSEQFNSSATVINGRSVSAGKAVQFLVSGQLAATERYSLHVTAITDSTPQRTIKRGVRFRVCNE